MTLVAIGGAEEKTGDMAVLKRVLAESGVEKPRVHVITTATGYPEEVAQKYREAFALLGINIEVSHITTPAQASDAILIADIKKADVIFFSGGDQLKLATALNGTPLLQAIKEREAAGAVVAGTSAGAAAMSSLMIYGGDPGKPVSEGGLLLTDGLGLARDIVFDTHFMNRERLPRLFNAVAISPAKTGIGLDEDTGVVIRAGGEIEVVGSGAVTVVNGDKTRSFKNGDKFRP